MPEKKWWAWQGLNLRPLRCQGRDTAQNPHKTAVFRCSDARTARERMGNRAAFYRTFTAQPADNAPLGTTRSFPPKSRSVLMKTSVAYSVTDQIKVKTA